MAVVGRKNSIGTVLSPIVRCYTPTEGGGRRFESSHPDQIQIEKIGSLTRQGEAFFVFGRRADGGTESRFNKFAGSEFERAKRARRVAGRTPAINLLTPTKFSS